MPHTVTDYLLDRLAECGVDRIFGVPGDFTLTLLDHIEGHASIRWVGCANELGAGYAADGYARIGGLGVLCTTFGVGELSAINAVAGSYAEHVPTIHVVGSPARATQAAARATHHTLGDGDFGHFARMSAEVTCVQAFLTPENAADEIDRVVMEVLEQHRPGYISIPTDVGEAPLPPPYGPIRRGSRVTDAAALADFSAASSELLASGRSVAVLADILVHRMGAESELARLLGTGLPHATLLWGRRVVDESAADYVGTYLGAVSAEAVRAPIEESDVLILAGVQFTDLTSGFFTQHLDDSRTIDIGPRSVTVAGTYYGPIDMRDALSALTEAIIAGQLPADAPSGTAAETVLREAPSDTDTDTILGEVPWGTPSAAGAAGAAGAAAGADTQGAADASGVPLGDVTAPLAPIAAAVETLAAGLAGADSLPPDALTQEALWDAVAAALRPGDVVLADQGTAFYGMGAHRLPHDVIFVGQPLWASIGYTLPALLGAALAAPARRPVLLIGDGAAQLTIADLGTLLRQGIPALIVVVNNSGYTVERAIHGPEAAYNEIARWDWTALVGALSVGTEGVGITVKTTDELDRALQDAAEHAARLTLIEAVVPPLDVPPLLAAIAKAASAANTPAQPGR